MRNYNVPPLKMRENLKLFEEKCIFLGERGVLRSNNYIVSWGNKCSNMCNVLSWQKYYFLRMPEILQARTISHYNTADSHSHDTL